MDDEALALLAEIKRHWEHWSGHLGLENWWIDMRFMDEAEQKVEAESEIEGSMTLTMHSGQYQRAYLKVNPDQSRSPFPLSRRVLHEACHVKYQVIDDYAHSTTPRCFHSNWDEIIETECDNTASIIWRLHELTGCKEA